MIIETSKPGMRHIPKSLEGDILLEEVEHGFITCSQEVFKSLISEDSDILRQRGYSEVQIVNIEKTKQENPNIKPSGENIEKLLERKSKERAKRVPAPPKQPL